MSPEEQALVARALLNRGTLTVLLENIDSPDIVSLVRRGVLNAEVQQSDAQALSYVLDPGEASLIVWPAQSCSVS